MNLTNIYASATRTLFAQTSFLKTITYIRPPSLTHGASVDEQTETTANCQAWAAPEDFAAFDQSPHREFMIRASELTAFGKPRKGDYMIDLDGDRYNVGAAKQTMGNLAWTIQTKKTIDHDDYGTVALAHGSSEDCGDLTAATSAEDYGALTPDSGTHFIFPN